MPRRPETMAVSLDELLRFPFSTRSRGQQQQIVASGKPRMINAFQLLLSKNKQQVPWLTYCHTRKRLLCWNCLLFMPSTSMLRVVSQTDFHSVFDTTKRHERTWSHMEATLKMQKFISENFQTTVRVGDKTQHNLTVKKNRDVLRRIIDAVCCTVAQKHSRGDGKYSFNLLKVEDCIKVLQLLRNFDRVDADMADGAIDLLKKQPKIVNDLVDVITRVVKLAIKNETHKSTYVSLILSEHATGKGKSQISSVLRYIRRGRACERFIGFTNVIANNSEQSILKLVKDTTAQYDISDRFLALAVEGEVLPRQFLISLIASVKVDFHYSYFVPWYYHGFGRDLMKTLTVFEECGMFLKMMNAIEKFFRNPNHFQKLEVTLLSKISNLRDERWYLKAPFVMVVASYRTYFIEFFESVIINCKYWETDDVMYAVTFREFLLELRTAFLLKIFLKLYSGMFDETYNFVVESRDKVNVFCNPKILEFKEAVKNLQFDTVWTELEEEIANKQESKINTEVTQRVFFELDSLFQKLLKHLFLEVDLRSFYLQRLKFCDLLNCNNDGKFVFSSRLFSDLMLEHGPFFKEEALKTEMATLTASDAFDKKSVHELLDYFAELNLRYVFPQLYKLAEFILTLPFLPVTCEKLTNSKLQDISKCSYMPLAAGIPSGEVSVLCVETELLRELKDSATFYNDVLARFYEVNQSLPLVQI